MNIILDTETNARTVNNKFTHKQHIIELGYYVIDEQCNIIKKVSTLIADVADEIFEYQKLFTMDDIKKGRKWDIVFSELLDDLQLLPDNGKVIAHNLYFDKMVIKFSCLTKNISQEKIDIFDNIVTKKGYCTMKNTINFCALQPIKYNNYKYPKLTELYTKLFNKNVQQKHVAIDDVHILYECVLELKKRNILNLC